MISTYDLGDGKPAYLLEDKIRVVQNRFLMYGHRVKVPYPKDEVALNKLGIMFDFFMKQHGDSFHIFFGV